MRRRSVTDLALVRYLMVIGALGTMFFGIPSIALAYNCNTAPTYGHCYGTVQWNGGVNGSDVRITVEHAYDNEVVGNIARHVTNEMWDVDPNHGTIYNGGISWIETGIIAQNGSEHYFWADARPSDTIVNTWVLQAVAPGDYGTTQYFEIDRDTSNSFHIIAAYLPHQYSTSNTMLPTQIIIGEEVNGTTSGSSDYTNWTNSRYIDSTGGHFYQFRDGDKKEQNSPVFSNWSTVPTAPAPPGTGGNWFAFCGC